MAKRCRQNASIAPRIGCRRLRRDVGAGICPLLATFKPLKPFEATDVLVWRLSLTTSARRSRVALRTLTFVFACTLHPTHNTLLPTRLIARFALKTRLQRDALGDIRCADHPTVAFRQLDGTG